MSTCPACEALGQKCGMKYCLDDPKKDSSLTTEEMLEKNILLAYDEPWQTDHDGTSDYASIQIRVTAKDAVKLKRYEYKDKPKMANLSDAKILDEFIVVHWAYTVDDNSNNTEYKKIKWTPNQQMTDGHNGKIGKHILFRVYFDAALPAGTQKRYKIESSIPKSGIYKKNRYHTTLEEAFDCCEKLFNLWYKGLNK